ncbi:MAG: hypothetical protein IPH62_15340 [Ignavibacteriae bacterium]|nr:hypothetical protein [Ignavibacteriota bacterium]
MKIKDNKDDLWGSYLTGLLYSGILAIILLLICFAVDESLFDSYITLLVLGIVCLVFFLSGFKKIEENNIGFVCFLGKRDFDQYYGEGKWWIFPFASFKQKPDIETLNYTEDIKEEVISKDDILLNLQVSYTWQLKDAKLHDKKAQANSVSKKLAFELIKFIKSNKAIELLSDIEISEKVMSNFLKLEGNKIGIEIIGVFPIINHHEQFKPVALEYERKYKELKYQLKQLKLIKKDMKIYQNQVLECIRVLGFSNEEALNFIKVYKNDVILNEHSYNFNIGELTKALDALINILKR